MPCRPGVLRLQRRVKQAIDGLLSSRLVVASGYAFFIALLFSSPVYADCVDTYSNVTYCGYEWGCGQIGNEYYFTQVATQSAPCVWYSNNPRTYQGANCNYLYKTEGGKGNISIGGSPKVWSNMDHAVAWMMSLEQDSDCINEKNGNTPGCWVQVGWQLGHAGSYNNCGGTTNTSSVQVEVEIYDDSTSPCMNALFGAAPSNASYDARFYTTLGNGLHRYQVYFEVPGSGNIQNLAYADFTDLLTAEIASGEAQPWVTGSGNPNCPILGQTPYGLWNVFGQPATQSTFADYMNLYTGSWQRWTTSVQPTEGYIWPPNGKDSKGQGSSQTSNPYQISGITNWGAGDYGEWETGGPHS